MKKVAFISEHASPLATIGGADSGGQNVYVAQLSMELSKQGFEVDIFTRWENPQDPEEVHWMPGVRVIHVQAGPKKEIAKEELWPHMEEFFENMYFYIAANRKIYQLFHANFWMSGYVAMRLMERLHIPYVITFHALGAIRKIHQKDLDKFPAERVSIETLVASQASKIIAECPQDRCDLMEHYKVPSHKIEVIPCGFNEQEFFPVPFEEACEKIGLSKDPIYFLQLGRMVPRKGVDNVIRAFSLLTTEYPNLRLLIVGGSKTKEEILKDEHVSKLHQLADELGVADKVIFEGRKQRSELKYYYSAASLFISTPWYEPFGITPLESMACGTPVIGSDVGGLKHSIIDGKTGFLVPPKSPKTLANRMRQILNDSFLRNEMAKASFVRVQENFTWNLVARSVKNLYAKVLSFESFSTQQIQEITNQFAQAKEAYANTELRLGSLISQAANLMVKALLQGNKILICGNGGSAAQSQHFAAELVGRFEVPFRKGLPALALTADTAILTAWANDFGYEDVFSRQVQSYGEKEDILITLSTSGNSPNLINAIKMAHKRGLTCINLLGKQGGEVIKQEGLHLVVPAHSSQRIQEIHLFIVHTLCSLVEKRLFNNPSKKSERLDSHYLSDEKVANGSEAVLPAITG